MRTYDIPPPLVNTGNPINPIQTYNKTLYIAFCLKISEANITNNVCRVIGTIETGTLIKAPIPMSTANNAHKHKSFIFITLTP